MEVLDPPLNLPAAGKLSWLSVRPDSPSFASLPGACWPHIGGITQHPGHPAAVGFFGNLLRLADLISETWMYQRHFKRWREELDFPNRLFCFLFLFFCNSSVVNIQSLVSGVQYSDSAILYMTQCSSWQVSKELFFN